MARNKTTLTLNPLSEFERKVSEAIKRTIGELKADQTTAMSRDNLLQVTRVERGMWQGSLCGTNAQYYYHELFNKAIDRDPVAVRFTRGMSA